VDALGLVIFRNALSRAESLDIRNKGLLKISVHDCDIGTIPRFKFQQQGEK
jgi:hypothetical protein